MVTFNHCKFQEFVPDDSVNPYQKCDGVIVFDHCLADYVKVYLAEFWMLGKNRIMVLVKLVMEIYAWLEMYK